MPERRITLHIDTLRYTPNGLELKTPLALSPGARNRLFLVRPTPHRSVPASYGGFARDSSFPTFPVLVLLLIPSLRSLWTHLAPGDGPRPVYQVFGHTDATGQDEHNKRLSERRAEVVAALLRGQVDVVKTIAKEEAWGLEQHQAMLRVLRCDPGFIDGASGEYTEAAVRLFQQEYRAGVFHRHIDEEPTVPDLPVDGALSSDTIDALIEAFVLACSPRLAPESMHPSHPHVGCSEFNPIVDGEDPANRRVSLVIYDRLPEHHGSAPCQKDDHSVCALVGPETQRCLWYREHVQDTHPEDAHHHHFDLRWLRRNDGSALLSALTTVPDGESVTFQVFRSAPVSGPTDLEPGSEAISGVLSGTVRMGVAQVIWEPPEDCDPWDVDTWYEPFSTLSPHEAWGHGAIVRVPFFRVEGGNATAISQPPGDDIGRVHAEIDPDAKESGEPPTAMHGLDGFGRILNVSLRAGRSSASYSAVGAEDVYLHGVRFTAQRHYAYTEDPDGR